MALVSAVMHFLFFFFNCFSPFHLYTFFLNLVLINRRSGRRYQRVLALCAFLTGAIPKGLILRKKNCLMFLYVFCTFMSGLVLLFLNNLWFDDWRAG